MWVELWNEKPRVAVTARCFENVSPRANGRLDQLSTFLCWISQNVTHVTKLSSPSPRLSFYLPTSLSLSPRVRFIRFMFSSCFQFFCYIFLVFRMSLSFSYSFYFSIPSLSLFRMSLSLSLILSISLPPLCLSSESLSLFLSFFVFLHPLSVSVCNDFI